jgi:nicotinamidase-related amidase
MKALVVIDVQREYIAAGRPFQIQGIGPSLNNAYTMLRYARGQGWPIVHVKHLQDGDLFNHASDKSDFIDGFIPEANEALAIKSNYSSFSSDTFAQFVANHPEHELVVVGYGTTMCCLSTIVDGYHRGHRFALVEDACAARAAKDYSEQSMHEHAVAILGPFARIARTVEETNVPI